MIKSKSELRRLIEQATVSRPKTMGQKGKEVYLYDDPTMLEVAAGEHFSVGVQADSENEAREKAYENLICTYPWKDLK